MDLVVANQVTDGGVRNHDLERHRPARPICPGHERLTDHTFEHEGELLPDLRLLIRRKYVDDSVDGLGAVTAM